LTREQILVPKIHQCGLLRSHARIAVAAERDNGRTDAIQICRARGILEEALLAGGNEAAARRDLTLAECCECVDCGSTEVGVQSGVCVGETGAAARDFGEGLGAAAVWVGDALAG